jgi:hypothetical protein
MADESTYETELYNARVNSEITQSRNERTTNSHLLVRRGPKSIAEASQTPLDTHTMNPTFEGNQMGIGEKPVTLDQLLAAGYSLQEIAKKKDRSELRIREEYSETCCHKSETLKQLRTVKEPIKPVIETVSPPAAKKDKIVAPRMNTKRRSHRPDDAVFTTRSMPPPPYLDNKPHDGNRPVAALPEIPSIHQAKIHPKVLTSKKGARCA